MDTTVIWSGLEHPGALPGRVADLLPAIRDEYDGMWLGASIGGAARFLVTYDNDFLQDVDLVRAMRERGTRIVKPAQFHRELDRL